MNLIDTADVYGVDGVGPRLRRRRGAARSGPRPGRRRCATGSSWRRRAASARRCRTTPRPTPCVPPARTHSAGSASYVIDLYQIHRPDLFAHPADVAATLADLRTAVKAREVGVSNSSTGAGVGPPGPPPVPARQQPARVLRRPPRPAARRHPRRVRPTASCRWCGARSPAGAWRPATASPPTCSPCSTSWRHARAATAPPWRSPSCSPTRRPP